MQQVKKNHAIRTIFYVGEGARKFLRSFYTWTIKYIEYRNEKNEYQSLMNIFAHFKDIDNQCTQQTIHNKLVLLIIDQFHCYYHQCDHYIRRFIERVVMRFFRKWYTSVRRARLSFCSYTLHHRSLYTEMQCVRTVNMPCSSACSHKF